MEIGKTINRIGLQRTAEKIAGAQGVFAQTSAAEVVASETGEQTSSSKEIFEVEKRLSDTAPPIRARIPELTRDRVLSSFVASDERSTQLLERLQRVAETPFPLLIRGERGTGRHLAAWVIHHLGAHSDQPLLRLDCRSIPRDVLEGELFGVERDGNSSVTRGSIELAAGGTLVLDEVAALDSITQAKLLRAIEDKKFERLGGTRSYPMHARIVALTSIAIERAVARRAFREDLYYRLNASPVIVTPLRDRPADIAPLTQRFLNLIAEIQRRPRIGCTPAAMAALEQYPFPGNVRELQSIIERAVESGGQEITIEDLPPHVRPEKPAAEEHGSLEEVEHAHIAKVLQFTQGKKSRAAKVLGISRKTLLEKRKKYGLG